MIDEFVCFQIHQILFQLDLCSRCRRTKRFHFVSHMSVFCFTLKSVAYNVFWAPQLVIWFVTVVQRLFDCGYGGYRLNWPQMIVLIGDSSEESLFQVDGLLWFSQLRLKAWPGCQDLNRTEFIKMVLHGPRRFSVNATSDHGHWQVGSWVAYCEYMSGEFGVCPAMMCVY